MSESLYRLQEALAAGASDTPDTDFKTVIEWAASWDRSESQAAKLLRDFVAAGLMERRVYRLKRNQKLFPVPHYREVKRT